MPIAGDHLSRYKVLAEVGGDVRFGGGRGDVDGGTHFLDEAEDFLCCETIQVVVSM